MPIILALIEFSLAGFLGCMGGPKVALSVENSSVTVRCEAYRHDGDEDAKWPAIAMGWDGPEMLRVSVWSPDGDGWYEWVSVHLHRLSSACIAADYDVDGDDDVDLRDWSALSREVVFCDSAKCYRSVKP